MERDEQLYPVGIQSFERIRTEGFVYVDKTGYIRRLLKKPVHYFLSRPRRFGKSLFLSTLEAYFNGRRDLFKGLSLDSDEVDWTPRPVIKMSLGKVDSSSVDNLRQAIGNTFSEYESEYGKDPDISALPQRLENIIRRAYGRNSRKVAVLIDEYDAPLLSTIDNPELNSQFRIILKSIFSVVKDMGDYVHFEFVTGVSRFSHTSLFSGANNLRDITFNDEYAAICGITEDELRSALMPGIERYARRNGISEEEALLKFKNNYDGYHFTPLCPDIYNPYSLLNALEDSSLRDYWFESGTPEFLLRSIREDDFFLPDLECIEVPSKSLGAIESYVGNPVALMFETGYLTIKSYDTELDAFTLGLPNEEVAVAFSQALLPVYSGEKRLALDSDILKMRNAVIQGNPRLFMDLLQTFLSGNPYGNTELKLRETYFKNNLYLILKALGFKPYAELQTCRGRMDLMLETRRYIYIFEMKVDHSSQEALAQIEEKDYALQWRHSGKTVIKLGANYNPSTNNIELSELRKK